MRLIAVVLGTKPTAFALTSQKTADLGLPLLKP